MAQLPIYLVLTVLHMDFDDPQDHFGGMRPDGFVALFYTREEAEAFSALHGGSTICMGLEEPKEDVLQ